MSESKELFFYDVFWIFPFLYETQCIKLSMLLAVNFFLIFYKIDLVLLGPVMKASESL